MQPTITPTLLALFLAPALHAAPVQDCSVLLPGFDVATDLFVDGNYVGQVKEVMNAATGPLLLAPGAHRVEVRKAGRFPVQRTVRVGQDQLGKVVTLEAELLTNPE